LLQNRIKLCIIYVLPLQIPLAEIVPAPGPGREIESPNALFPLAEDLGYLAMAQLFHVAQPQDCLIKRAQFSEDAALIAGA